ncbi:MAG: hypothetical protein Q9176_000260 [Flavoplaca citrina]
MAKKMKKAPTRTIARTTHRPQELKELDLRTKKGLTVSGGLTWLDLVHTQRIFLMSEKRIRDQVDKRTVVCRYTTDRGRYKDMLGGAVGRVWQQDEDDDDAEAEAEWRAGLEWLDDGEQRTKVTSTYCLGIALAHYANRGHDARVCACVDIE